MDTAESEVSGDSQEQSVSYQVQLLPYLHCSNP